MKNLLTALFLLATAVVTTAATAQDRNGQVRYLMIGTGQVAGTYFPVGQAIASAISLPPGAPDCEAQGRCGVPGLIALAQVTEGTLGNIRGVAEGRFETGLAQSSLVTRARAGEAPFYALSAEYPSLRVIANLYPEWLHVVVRADGDIKTFADLKGKKVSLGQPGTGTRIGATLILSAHDLDEERHITAVELPARIAAEQLAAGHIDAFIHVGGVPVPFIGEQLKAGEIRLIAPDPLRLNVAKKRYPLINVGMMPLKAYGLEENFLSAGTFAQWITTVSQDEELVYQMTKALWHPGNRQVLSEAHPVAAGISPDNALIDRSAPLHPGAARYYREVGLLSDDAPEAQPVDRQVPVPHLKKR